MTEPKKTKSAVHTYDPGTQITGEDFLCLHRNENLFVGREWTVDAAREVIAEAHIGAYPEPTCQTLREVLAESLGLSPDHIFVGNGSDEVLSDLLGYLRARYDTLGLLDVRFKIYDLLADRFGYEPRTIPGETFHTGRIDPDGWRGLAMIDSPNAITGRALERDSLLSLAADPGSFLIWDNAYGEFAGDELPRDMPANAVLVRSFSKFYALAGLRVGYCVGDPALIKELLDRKDAFNVNAVAQRMAVEALRRRDMFERIAREIIACRDELVRSLEGLGFVVYPPAGNYVLARHRAIPGSVIHEELAKRHVAVRRFAEPPTENCIRITVPPRPEIARFLEALGAVLETTDGRVRPQLRDARLHRVRSTA